MHLLLDLAGSWSSRSLPFEAIRDAVALEVDRGAKEVVLTGVDITDYDGGLGILCRRLLDAKSRLTRLRLSSLDSVEIDDELFELIAGEKRLMPHFHLSLQAGDDMILKRMKRRHSRAQAVAAVEQIKAVRSEATIGADLIAGFPTETEEMSLNSLKLLDDCDVVAAHIFPFSPRPNTPASRMPQVSREVVKARSDRLRQKAAERRSRWLDSLIGSTQSALAEGDSKGHTDNFAPVAIDGSARGESGRARVMGESMTVSRLCGHELARSPAWRVPEDCGQGCRQSHGADEPGGARHVDSRRHRRSADRFRPGTGSLAPIREAIARQKFERLDERGLRSILADEIEKILRPVARPLEITGFPRPHVILVIGVNGSGKTTTIGKLGKWLKEEDYGVLFAAGDTFRAAAIDQLKIWGERIGAPVISGKEGGDAAGIVFDGVKQATATGEDVLIVDTAGRLQNKTHLMEELAKIRRVLGRLNPEAPHDMLLVLDATTGQNALAQVETFRDSAGVTGLIMTKLDGTARGGVLVAAAEKFGLPIHAIGVGETADDLRPFDARAVARAIAGLPPE